MVYVFILVFWALWGMSNGVEWTLQAEKMDLHWLGMDLIAAQVQTANPILILIFIPLVNYLIYPLINRVFPLTPLRSPSPTTSRVASLVRPSSQAPV